jgi:hypothetical protein
MIPVFVLIPLVCQIHKKKEKGEEDINNDIFS